MLSESEVHSLLSKDAPRSGTLKLVLVGIGDRIYKREGDGCYHLLDNEPRTRLRAEHDGS